MNGPALLGASRRQIHGQSRSTHANTPREPSKVRIFMMTQKCPNN